jgi:hypothetical protein
MMLFKYQIYFLFRDNSGAIVEGVRQMLDSFRKNI